MFSLRSASQSDDGAIHALVYAARINPSGLDWRRFVLAVSLEGEVIGCGQIKPHRDGSRELASIVVAPDWRGNGVARAILEYLIASNPGLLYLTCRARLGPLYEKFGFRVASEGELTPYFRRLSRLAKVIEFVSLGHEGLLVMLRQSH